jgi:UPF0042 nucleotide-binding protein
MAEFVVIAGLSGAGRTTAADAFEDLGWYVIDNLPPSLLPQVVDLTRRAGAGTEDSRVVLVMGRSAVGEELLAGLDRLRKDGEQVSLVFLDAPDDVLVRRFEDRRRKHPLSTQEEQLAVAESIAVERALLIPVKDAADLVIDTSDLNVHQLRDRLVELFSGERPKESMAVTLLSFGYKHGIPLDADMVLDVRFLPNPHWVPALRPFTGRDEPVRDAVLGAELAQAFLDRIDDLLGVLLPAFVVEGKAYLTIAIGCTGGRHRSVAIAAELARRISDHGHRARVVHRDVER